MRQKSSPITLRTIIWSIKEWMRRRRRLKDIEQTSCCALLSVARTPIWADPTDPSPSPGITSKCCRNLDEIVLLWIRYARNYPTESEKGGFSSDASVVGCPIAPCETHQHRPMTVADIMQFQDTIASLQLALRSTYDNGNMAGPSW
jgi:hypothetical protein